MEAYVEIKNLAKSYERRGNDGATKLHALDDITMGIGKGEFVTFFGPNGCGKTTLLNIIAGLILPDKGTVRINGHPPTNVSIGYIFQNYRDTILPWRSNLGNIVLPLLIQKVSKKDARAVVKSILETLAIDLPLKGYPYQLSGGQQQLLVIARALVLQPDLLLLDEPFSALDFTTRMVLQQKMLEIWDKTHITTLFVSHDLDEALYLADRLIILSQNPARITATLDVDLPRPRTAKLIEEDAFFDLRRRALEIIMQINKV